jgi:hypothetical protein
LIIILFIFVLFGLVGLTKACINDPSNITEVLIENANGCYLNCTDLIKYSYVCYSDIGIYYSLWIWISIISLVCLSIWTSYCFYIILKSNNNKNIFKWILFFNLLAINIRLIWISFRTNGHNPHDMVGDLITNTILKNIPQSVLLSEFCAIIIVWKSIIHSTIELRVLTDAENNKNYMYVITFCLLLFVSTFSFSIIGISYPIFIHVSNSLSGVVILGLIVGSIRYSFKIREIIRSLISTDNTTIKNIKFMNDLSCTLAILIVSSLVINLFGVLNISIIKFFFFLVPIYGSEIAFMYVVSYTVSYEYIQAYKFNKISPISTNKISTIGNTTSRKKPVVIIG